MLQDLKDQEIQRKQETEALTLKRLTIFSLLKRDMNQTTMMVQVAIARVVAAVEATITTNLLHLLARFNQAVVEVEALLQAAEVEITLIKVTKEVATIESDIYMSA